jgi:purine-nucleoside phosphorylase
VNTGYKVGDLALITDYINFTHKSPLVGFDVTGFDTRFVDMSHAYDRDFRNLAKAIAEEQKISLQSGVYFYMPGPQFETPAEIRAIRILGGDLVGMSAVHETIMARRLGMRILGLALVTNMAAGILDVPLTEEEVLVEGKKASKMFSGLIKSFVEKM